MKNAKITDAFREAMACEGVVTNHLVISPAVHRLARTGSELDSYRPVLDREGEGARGVRKT